MSIKHVNPFILQKKEKDYRPHPQMDATEKRWKREIKIYITFKFGI